MSPSLATKPPLVCIEDRILDATERLLGRHGYRKTTMDDIAHEAGVAKRTIYMHFPSKEEVALSSIDRIVERLVARLDVLARKDSPSSARIKEMLLCRVLFRFDSVRNYHQSLDDLFESLRPAYLARRMAYFDREAAVFANVLLSGQDAGEFALGDPLETAHTLLRATNSLLPSSLSVLELGKRTEVERKTRQVAELLLNGLRRRSKRS